MKNLFYLTIVFAMLTSCGNKLYSYRKTVKVKEVVAQKDNKSPEAKVYMTIKEVKPTAKLVSPSNKKLTVSHNTVYTATKPANKTTPSNAPSLSSTLPVYGATIR